MKLSASVRTLLLPIVLVLFPPSLPDGCPNYYPNSFSGPVDDMKHRAAHYHLVSSLAAGWAVRPLHSQELVPQCSQECGFSSQ